MGQPSTRVATENVEAWVTKLGGHIGPVTFRLGDRNICPLHVAPWCDETWAEYGTFDETENYQKGVHPPILRVLRGDFFCMPFGGNAVPFQGELHGLHGEPANRKWSSVSNDGLTAKFTLETKVRPGKIEKEIRLVPGTMAVYSRHTIREMSGPMTMGHHAMLRFQTPGLVSVAPFNFGQSFPGEFETPAGKGYPYLSPGTRFSDLTQVPGPNGELVDLSKYPARRGYEDFVLVYTAPDVKIGWTVVVFPEEGYLWFSFKNPKVLTGTALWHSNAGRYYEPWNGRHQNVLGLEEVTTSVGTGLADSLGPNEAAVAGQTTILQLDPAVPTVVNTIFGIAPITDGFDRVVDVNFGEREVTFTSASGLIAKATVHLDHLEID
jgi:hypothetical protein